MAKRNLILVKPSSANKKAAPHAFIPAALRKELTIPETDTLIFMAGKESVEAHFNPSIEVKDDMDEEAIWMDESCFKQLNLPLAPLSFQAIYKNGILHLGPVIALLTEWKAFAQETPYFGSLHAFCEEFQEYSEQHGGFLYITNPSLYPEGYYYTEGKWMKGSIPRPNIVYNRIHSRKRENSSAFKAFTAAQFEQEQIAFFNDRYLSKWEVHQLLSSKGNLEPYLPDTDMFTFSAFKEQIEKYKDVFIKPIHGSQGRYIIHVWLEDGHFKAEQTNFSDRTFFQFKTLQEAFIQLEKWIQRKPFIIQQGLPLASLEDKKVDFRLLTHFSTHNRWKLTSAVARISAEKMFVSNLAQGGQIERPLQALEKMFNRESAVSIYKRMTELALEISEVLSSCTVGLFAELGLDIGVNQAGRPYLIEVNIKPSKQRDEPIPPIRPSVKAIYHFCEYAWKERSLLL